MHLKAAEIRNFRSIGYAHIEFDPPCRILVGINESGKSNLLRALALLSTENAPSIDDVREPRPDEPPVEEAYVRFIFSIDQDSLAKVESTTEDSLLRFDTDAPLIRRGAAEYALHQLIRHFPEMLYRVDLKTGERRISAWRLDPEYKAVEGWMKVMPTCPPDLMVVSLAGSPFTLKNYKFVRSAELLEPPSAFLEPASATDLIGLVDDAKRALLKESIPPCILWRYEDSFLLPTRLDFESFASDPSTCLPLKHMFELAGITNIREAYDNEKRRTTGLRNLLNRVAQTATRHLRSVWKEASGISIELLPSGAQIEASVRDAHNYFGFAQRSDGFKRLVTFLLMISARVHSQTLRNAVLLYDEPEISLHPSGAQYLRDELIASAKANIVVFSTHSPFMIDRNKIERHLIVRKKGEKTELTPVDESNYRDEEVIFNALGASLFDVLKEQNLVFEGRRDLVLFEAALKRVPSEFKEIKSLSDSVGRCFVKGAKAVKGFTPILALANRNCLIVSDGDPVAKQEQQEYEGWGSWVRYDELLPGDTAITAEDFITVEAFMGAVKRVQQRVPAAPSITVDDLNDPRGKLDAYVRLVAKGRSFDAPAAKRLAEQVKEELFGEIRGSHIETKYYRFLSELLKRLMEQRDEGAPSQEGT